MASSNPIEHPRQAPVIDPATCRALSRALSGWYARTQRDLPWRRTSDPYRIWVSEVMLQQTRVQTVEPYYLRFIAQFGDVSSLARADLQSVLKLWEGLGYYSRARNLHKAAGVVVAEMAGKMPDTWDALRRLPGIGDYIAAAVLSIAFNRAYAVVDGNVKRVLARLFLVEAPANQASAHKVFHLLAGQLLDERLPGIHNQAMMELGALICRPRGPECHLCPLHGYCRARQLGVVQLYPQRNQRNPLPTRRMVAGVVLKNHKVLLVQRPEQGMLGGLWEFPGGPLEEGADPVRVCHEQLKAVVNLNVSLDRRLDAVLHAYTHFRLHMEICLCRWQFGRVRLDRYIGFKWLSPDRIGHLPLHGVTLKALAALRTLPEWSQLHRRQDQRPNNSPLQL